MIKMARKTSTISLLASNILIPIAILIFASGFFPYKSFLSGLAQYEFLDYGPPPEAPFDKVVFMVVDALRRYGLGEESREWLTGAVILYIPDYRGSILRKGMFNEVAYAAQWLTICSVVLLPVEQQFPLQPMPHLLLSPCQE